MNFWKPSSLPPVRRLAATTLLAALSACSGEPSSSDVKSLVERDIKPALEQEARLMNNMGSMFGIAKAGKLPTTLTDVKKIGCKQDGESAYLCDVELILAEGAENKSRVIPLRFVKASSGWLLTR